jgi:caffeoyl-CoA O-methyltransferase
MNIISKKILEYAELHSSKEPDLLSELNRETYVNHLFPRMLSGHLQGRFLSIISSILHPRRVLEVGTFTGYSAICLAEGLADGGTLHTIDLNDENEGVIRKYIKKAGFEDRIKLHFGDALHVIPSIDGNFDLIFLDADKENYVNYYELLFDKLNTGGILLADNTLWSGKILDNTVNDKETLGIREFNKIIAGDKRVEKVIITIRDGITMILKK